jgi:hypothetical protein
VLAADSHAVVGLVEGLWLRGTSAAIAKSSAQSNSVPGAAVPIDYAISLLKEHNVTWSSAPASLSSPPPAVSAQPTPPRPLREHE